jgi:hypothetical protein
MTDVLVRHRPQIDDPKELERVVRRLVEAFDPVAVYLFGSRARGDAGEDSDYDLMLVLADDNQRVRSRQDVWQTARSRRIFVNPFLTRAQSFAWRRHEVGTLEHEVQVDGIRLYPASGQGSADRGGARRRGAAIDERQGCCRMAKARGARPQNRTPLLRNRGPDAGASRLSH